MYAFKRLKRIMRQKIRLIKKYLLRSPETSDNNLIRIKIRIFRRPNEPPVRIAYSCLLYPVTAASHTKCRLKPQLVHGHCKCSAHRHSWETTTKISLLLHYYCYVPPKQGPHPGEMPCLGVPSREGEGHVYPLLCCSTTFVKQELG